MMNCKNCKIFSTATNTQKWGRIKLLLIIIEIFIRIIILQSIDKNFRHAIIYRLTCAYNIVSNDTHTHIYIYMFAISLFFLFLINFKVL